MLRLAQGDLRRRWQGAFLVAGAGFWDHWRVGRAFGRAEARAALVPAAEAEVARLLAPAERGVAERFLASLRVHDHGGM